MTRARRRAGAPTVASRLLQRIEAVAGGKAWAALRARGATALDWARRLDAPRDAADPARLAPIGRPAPRPPVAARPTALSVTSFETLRRDPYAIHADRILDLKPLEGYGLPEDAAAFGTALHAVVAEFARVYPAGPLPDAARARLFDIARAVFAAERADAAFAAQQWPRIEAILDAFLVWERGRRHDLAATLVERRGEIALTLDDATIFTLSATPDRIERGRTGALRVVDFKTGSVPGPGDVAAGLSPQLTLEGAMAARGAFGPDFSAAAKGAAPPPPISGVYVALKPAEAKDRAAEGGKARASFADLAQEHLEQARALLSAYRSPDVGYVSEIAPQYSRVAHLARVQEWSATGGAAPDAGDGEGEGE